MTKAQELFNRTFPSKTIGSNIITINIERGINGKVLEGELKVEGFSSLKKLDCSKNKLTKLSIINCQNLEVIICSFNNLTEIKINDCGKLTKIVAYCNYLPNVNFLVDLPRENKERLTYLDISDNNISDYDWGFFGKKRNKKVLSLDFLEEFINLECLYLHNGLEKFGAIRRERKEKDIESNNFGGSIESLAKLKKLRELDVSNNSGIYGSLESLNKISNLKEWKIEKTNISYGEETENYRVVNLEENEQGKLIKNFPGSDDFQLKEENEEIQTLKNQLLEKEKELEKIHSIVLPDTTFNLIALKSEIERLKKESLGHQIEIRKSELEKLKSKTKNKLGRELGFMLEILLEIQADAVKSVSDPFVKSRLKDLKNSLEEKVGKGEIEIICQKQAEIAHLEQVTQFLESSQKPKSNLEKTQVEMQQPQIQAPPK